MSGDASSNDAFDPLCGVQRVFVLPHDDEIPTLGAQQVLRVAITSDVGCELLCPPVRVALRLRGVRGAGVPEAAPDLDDHAGADEHDVVATSRRREHGIVDAVSKASAVQLSPEGEFRRRVPAALTTHSRQRIRRRRAR